MSQDPTPSPRLQAVFDGINRKDEDAFIDAFAPDLRYFGSMTGTVTHGRGALRGVFRATVDVVGFAKVEPLETFGQERECGVRCGVYLPGDAAPSAEQVMVFRWDPAGLIDRYSILWDAAGVLAKKAGRPGSAEPAEGRLSTGARAFMTRYFDTFNRDDLEGHAQLLAPDLEVFGSLVNTEVHGLAAARGVFTSARTNLGIRRLVPMRSFGDAPEFAVLAGMGRDPEGPPETRALWVFTLDASERLTRMSILWNPLPFLKRAGGVP